MKNFKYDYYDVEIPREFMTEETPFYDSAFVFSLAEERIRIWASPCQWTILDSSVTIGGVTVKVRRRRRRTK